MQKWLKKSTFTLWLFTVVFLAFLFPGPASDGGVLHSEITTKLGVWLIFFLRGLSLRTRELALGYKPMRLHAFVLFWNYLGFPLVAGALLIPFAVVLPAEFRLAFWLLAIMPTTIASAVTFTTLAQGNASNAIVSTVLSNVLSVFIVPAIAVAYLTFETSVSVPLLPLLSKIAALILVPLIAGQLLRGMFAVKAAIIGKQARWISSVIILFIVHAAFANSIRSGHLDALSLSTFTAVLGGVLLLLFLVNLLVWWTAGFIRLSHSQQIAAFYCASQKSLATGLPLAMAILATASEVVDPATTLIPLLLFHPIQLVLAGALTKRFSKLRF